MKCMCASKEGSNLLWKRFFNFLRQIEKDTHEPVRVHLILMNICRTKNAQNSDGQTVYFGCTLMA